MATGTGKWYTRAGKHVAMGELIWKAVAGSTVKIALLTSAHTPNQDTHEFFSDISPNQVAAGGGYTAGGEVLTKIDASYDAATNTTILDANDVTWSASTITARYAVIYIDTGTPATSALLGYITFDAEQASANGNFVVEFNATTGVLKMVAA
jgi:hypothetical protein